MKLRKGNVFTPVSQSFCSLGGGEGAWQGACVAGGHVWQGMGACMAGGHALQEFICSNTILASMPE